MSFFFTKNIFELRKDARRSYAKSLTLETYKKLTICRFHDNTVQFLTGYVLKLLGKYLFLMLAN